ncbi:MAG: O-antigen ligase family protein [Gemmataceae bacterium]
MSKGAILVYLLAYGGSAVALFDPFIGVLIYIGFAILRPEAIWGFALGVGNNFSRFIALALLAGWMFRGFGNWQFGRAKGIVIALLCFLGWMIISAVPAPRQDVAWGMIEPLAKTVLPFIVGMTVITSIKQLKALAWVIALSHGYVAYELNLVYYRDGLNQVQEYGFAGMDNNCVAITMATGAGLAFFLGLQAPRLWQKLLAFASAALMVHVVMLAFSRGGMLALVICGIISFFLIPKRPVHYFYFAVAVAVALRLAGEQVVERFMTTFAEEGARDGSAQSRIDMWKDCLEIMARFPILGVGPHHFPIVAPQFGWPPGKEAHSLWLQIGAEVGVPGLAFLLAFYGICCVKLLPLLFRRGRDIDPWYQDTARMVIASLVAFAISAQFVSLVGLEVPYYVVLLGAGTLKLYSTAASPVGQSVAVQPLVLAAPRLPGFILH